MMPRSVPVTLALVLLPPTLSGMEQVVQPPPQQKTQRNTQPKTQPKPQDKPPKQYKRIHQGILKAVVNGKIGKAREDLAGHLRRAPEDPENWFLATIVEATAGKLPEAVAHMARAIELGLPPGRFLAGPRDLLAPLADTEEFRKLVKEFAHRPIHGPMLGCMQGTSVKVWMRTATATAVQVLAKPEGSKTTSQTTRGTAASTASSDFTAVVSLTGLTPATRYVYEIRVGDGEPIPGGSFKTFPAEGQSAKIRVAFGGGAGYVPEHERMWQTIEGFRPDLLLLLGDNVYIDAPRKRELQHYTYYRRQSRPEFRKIIRSIPVFTIWDDHDFGTNDCFYGSAVDKPAFKPKVFEVFRQNWVNPGYGLEQTPACFYDFKVGDLYFMLLDGRYYRSDPKLDKPTMLGERQRNWLKYRLAGAMATQASFKMVCSPVPWSFDTKGGSRDTWNGFKAERKEIFDFIGGFKIEGVFLLSADRHRTDIWKIDRKDHYPFIEFNSSRLTNQHVHKTMPKAEFSYNKKQSFGLLEFDPKKEDPIVTLKAVTIDGEVVHTKVLRYSELCYK